MRRVITVTLASVATLLVSAAAALAGPAGRQPLTFSGQCQFAGTSLFSSPVTPTPARIRNNVSATGTCSGTLTGHNGQTTTLNGAPVGYRASEVGPEESCAGDPDAAGSGRLIFAQGALAFAVVENRVSGQAALTYTGAQGGSAAGVAYVNSSDPAGVLEQCVTSGLTSAPVSIVFATSPSISG